MKIEQKGEKVTLYTDMVSIKCEGLACETNTGMTIIIFGTIPSLQIYSKSICGCDMRILPSWTVVGLQSLWQLGSTSKIHKYTVRFCFILM